MFQSSPSTIWKEFKVLNLIFISLCFKLWFIDLLLVGSISVIPCSLSCLIIPWTNFRQSGMHVHVTWLVLNRETLLKKTVKISIGFLSIAVSSLSSYYWPIRSFTQSLIISIVPDYLSSQIYVKSSARFTRSSLGPICEVPRSCQLEIGRLLVQYQICGISCRYLSVQIIQ